MRVVIHKPAGPVESSLAVLRRGQTPSGAFLASPTFPTYRYCWFRDGAFIAQALDLWGDHDRAAAFYDWGVRIVAGNLGVIERVLKGPPHVAPAEHLHARYEPNGSPSRDEWPTFQLDGFGTFLWGLMEHLRLTGKQSSPEWRHAIALVIEYLVHLWKAPNFDCWEEYPDEMHLSTLCAIAGGAAAVRRHLDSKEAASLARAASALIKQEAAKIGFLPKFIGNPSVDASLLWAAIPFGVLETSDPFMVATVKKIESDLLGEAGGLHRYATDSYYGGGEWILLTALLGEYYLASGECEKAHRILQWVEEQVTPLGDLPEQVPLDLIQSEYYDVWVNRWGPIASPLLWSHAAHLRLKHALESNTRHP